MSLGRVGVTRNVTRLQLRSALLHQTRSSESLTKRGDTSPPGMSSIHAARRLLGPTTGGARAAVVGRTYATKQSKKSSLAQKTKSQS